METQGRAVAALEGDPSSPVRPEPWTSQAGTGLRLYAAVCPEPARALLLAPGSLRGAGQHLGAEEAGLRAMT